MSIMVKDKIKLVQEDITHLAVDAIVNAANTSLLAGGGVCGVIHRAAGPKLAEECNTLNGCPTGQAKITKGYDLPAKYVIHAVGPVWHGGAKGEAKLLASCYIASLNLALQHHIETIAFPAISCGIYGYPVDQASMIAVKETLGFLESHPELQEVIFVCFDKSTYDAYRHALDSIA